MARQLVSVLGVGIDSVTMQQAVAIVDGFVRARTMALVATANAEMVMLAQQDHELFSILNNAELTLADGAGVVWAARRLGSSVPERVAGYDLTQQLLQHAAKTGYKIFWLGAAPGVAEAAAAKAAEKYPGLATVGVHDGFFDCDDGAIRRLIRDSQADILLCALGVPKQEKWLNQYRHELQIPVMIGVGGTFDVMAGKAKRAPVWMQRAGLEWSYRLLRQPSRFVRMLALPRFVAQVLLSAWTSR